MSNFKVKLHNFCVLTCIYLYLLIFTCISMYSCIYLYLHVITCIYICIYLYLPVYTYFTCIYQCIPILPVFTWINLSTDGQDALPDPAGDRGVPGPGVYTHTGQSTGQACRLLSVGVSKVSVRINVDTFFFKKSIFSVLIWLISMSQDKCIQFSLNLSAVSSIW